MAITLTEPAVDHFLAGKTAYSVNLYQHFIEEFSALGDISIHAAKTMLGISNGQKRVAWVTQFGRSFLHVVLPFHQPFNDNLCFVKVAQVPGSNQYNHHLRIIDKEDINDEVREFLRLALKK